MNDYRRIERDISRYNKNERYIRKLNRKYGYNLTEDQIIVHATIEKRFWARTIYLGIIMIIISVLIVILAV